MTELSQNATLDYDITLIDINANPTCSGARLGYNISRQSCNSALGQIGQWPGDPIFRFGQRVSASWPKNDPLDGSVTTGFRLSHEANLCC